LLAEEAAHDLGIAAGETISLTYPRRVGPEAFTEVTERVTVVGLHGDPFRIAAYMDEDQAARMGLAGEANALDIVPGPGVSEDDLKLTLFGLPGVAGVERATASTDFVRKRMNDFVGILRVTVLFALLLALLIAFNSTSISADERARENATMEAYGVTVPRIVGMSMVEALITGVLGTIAGIGLGLGITGWVLNSTLPRTLPELGVPVSISAGSVAIAALVGVIAVAAAPLLTARRIRRMNIPDTLRVVE
jgi:putative ABC transport system permease protein